MLSKHWGFDMAYNFTYRIKTIINIKVLNNITYKIFLLYSF